MLQRLDLADRFVLMAPILRSKLHSMDRCAELVSLLDSICVPDPDFDVTLKADRSRRARDTRTLHTALKFMSARSLLALLSHAPVCKDSARHQAIEHFLQHCSFQRRLDDESASGVLTNYSRTDSMATQRSR